MTLYDEVGSTYSVTRRPDPRIADQIRRSLDGMSSVVNIGAGAGSYEPPQTRLAVEPSAVMIAQRLTRSAPPIRATAEELPLQDDSFDAALASLTVHHWHDLSAGVAEMVRVARRRSSYSPGITPSRGTSGCSTTTCPRRGRPTPG